ncbi:FxsA family protein [Poseidonocella sedimentorum]|uniref:UPF0716 protein FxsA n=1 Tax=Poseidonocella sedimentorum TaxID=871652 RepID=A0A1I6D6L9_9RHOB|nr:FxsA family protein [Poseidonocella sedimentorum]SFR01114.1 UPF0716 protein FxsA [Poseidonocella sedimentorum]
MWLFVLFLAIPLIEIGLFIQVGGAIGLWPTLLIVIVTAIAGTWLVRSQGRGVMSQIRRSFNELNDPTEPLAHGAMILFAGALLLTPGFFTDAVGFSLLIPPVRRSVFKALKSRVSMSGFAVRETRRSAQPGTIDGDFEDLTPRGPGSPDGIEGSKRPTHEPSGWTKH